VWTSAALQTRDELQEDAIDAIAQTTLVPLNFAWMLLALVQQQRLHDIRRDWIARQIQVTIP